MVNRVLNRPARPCLMPGCPHLRPCLLHPARAPFAAASRASDLYGTHRWKLMRKEQLSADPTCRQCGAPATVADHVVPHRGDETLFWAKDNLQSLCRDCSNTKTAHEVRGRREGRR